MSELSIESINPIKNIRNSCSTNYSTIEVLIKLIELIKNKEWDRAKTLWILCINSMKPNSEWQFSTFGSKYEFFVKHLLPFQEIIFECGSCKFACAKPRNEFTIMKNFDKPCSLSFDLFEKCKKCEKLTEARFSRKPFILFVSPLENQRILKETEKISIC